MGKVSQKYNWADLKNDFFLSDCVTVAAWIRKKFGKEKLTGVMAKNTTGWAEQKQKWQKDICDRILRETADEEVEQKKADLRNILGLMRASIEDAVKKKTKINPYQIETFWRMIRTENGLPTVISKNENKNQNTFTDFLQKAKEDAENPNNDPYGEAEMEPFNDED